MTHHELLKKLDDTIGVLNALLVEAATEELELALECEMAEMPNGTTHPVLHWGFVEDAECEYDCDDCDCCDDDGGDEELDLDPFNPDKLFS